MCASWSSSANSISILFFPRTDLTFTVVSRASLICRAARLYDAGSGALVGLGASSVTENNGARLSVCRTDKRSSTTLCASLILPSSLGTASIARA